MDYRRWLVFNSDLNDQKIISDLHRSLKAKNSKGSVIFSSVSQENIPSYTIRTSNYTEHLVIPISELPDFISYLEKHYIPGVESKVVYSNQSVTSPATSITVTDSSTLPEWLIPFFINRRISYHVLGYALVGFIVSQLFVLPQFIGEKLPDVFRYVFLGILFALTHLAVRNYKKHFLEGGIRYGIVRKITFRLFVILFSAISIEVLFGDVLQKADEFSFFAAFFICAIIVLAGLLAGWILSVPVYFINGGKMVSDPDKIKLK